MPDMTLARILVPTDFSDTSAAALKYGIALADTFGARLHLLHVLDSAVEQQWEVKMSMLAHREIEAEAVQRSNEELALLLTRPERERYRAALVTERGSPAAAIVRYARSQDIDLIVMGTHGRGPVAHLLIGSVAENVVRSAPCPVLTVPLKGHDFVTL